MPKSPYQRFSIGCSHLLFLTPYDVFILIIQKKECLRVNKRSPS